MARRNSGATDFFHAQTNARRPGAGAESAHVLGRSDRGGGHARRNSSERPRLFGIDGLRFRRTIARQITRNRQHAMFSIPPGAARRAAVIFVLSLLLVAAVYRDTPVNFLRDESGWYLVQSHLSEENQQRFERDLFAHSYGGHYTPFAFLAEFQTAKIVGTNESFWKWRQILALALVGAALCGAAYAIGGVFQLSRWSRWAMGAVLAAGAVFRPEIMEFIGWPFMIFQLLWIGSFILALYAAVRVASAPEQTRWPWIAAATACASIQVSGLGLVTVVAVAAVLAGILLVARRCPSSICAPHRKRIASALIAMLAVAAAHGWAMLHLLPSHPSFSAPFRLLCKLWLGFTANLAAATARTFIGTAISEPGWRSLAYGWPYGLLIVAASLFLIFWLLGKSLREPTPQNLTRFALHAFSISAFLALIGLSAVRQFQADSFDTAAINLALSTTLPRYVVPLHFIVIASAIGVAARLIQRAPRLSSAAFCALALAAVVAQRYFRSTTFVYVAPLERISHASAWGLLLSTIRECQAAQLPVPNVPMAALTHGFVNEDAKSFESLWRHDLHLKPEEKIEIIPWEQYLAGGRERYGSVPSLRLLEQKLGLRRD